LDKLKLYIHGGSNKQSGIGRLAAIEHYTQLKWVYVEGSNVTAPC
jgi:hypothetical protein